MAPTPPTADGPTPTFSPGHEDRIRRNVACINCRNSKVRCKASPVPGQPCQRCSKLHISCVVDKSHKRVTKRSKLEQLEQELKSLKQVVHPKANGTSAWTPPSPRTNVPQIQERQRTPLVGLRPGITPQIPTPVPDGPPSAASSTRTSERPPKTTPTQTRVLGTHVVAGDDIDWYFDKFLQHFHPFLPILRRTDPDDCFDACPTLFWVILLIACRRHCRTEGLYTDLAEFVAKDIWTCLSNRAPDVDSIHAGLFLCFWPLPTIRLVTDPSTVFASIAMNVSMLSGFHLGRGNNDEFCFGSRGHVKATDEEASSTCIASCLVSQVTHATSGMPPPVISINDTVCKRYLDSREWTDLVAMYEIQKFLNRFDKFIYAQLLASRSVADTVVREWEDEFEQMKPLIAPHRSDIVNVMLLAARLQIQQYYFFGPSDTAPANVRMHHNRVFHSSRVFIETVSELENRYSFLSHAPHWVFRLTLDATSVIFYILISTFAPPDFPADDANRLAQQGYSALVRFSTRKIDMPHRANVVMETFWSARNLIPKIGKPITGWPDRLGSGLSFACARRFKEDLQEVRKANENVNRKLEAIQPPDGTGGINDAQPQTRQQVKQQGPQQQQLQQQTAYPQQQQLQQDMSMPSALGPGIDPFQDVDWSMFMDDFGWAGNDGVFMGLP